MKGAEKVAAMRAVLDYIERHDLAEHVLVLMENKVQVYAPTDESAVAILVPWAESLRAEWVGADLVYDTIPSCPGEGSFHLHVTGEVAPGVPLKVVVVVGQPETAAIAAADLWGRVPLADIVAAVAGVQP